MVTGFVVLLCAASFLSATAKGVAVGPRLNNNQLYKLSYTTEVRVSKARGSPQSSTGYRLSSDVDIHLVWRDPSSKDDQLIQLAISNVRVEHVAQKQTCSSNQTIYVASEKWKGKSILFILDEPAIIKNIKRGVASLLQLQLHTGKVIENDVSGRCTVEYKAKENQVTRTKIIDTCKTPETGFTTHNKVSKVYPQFNILYIYTGVGVSKKASSVTIFTIEDGFLRSVVAEEAHSLTVNAHKSTSAKVVSRQTLTLVGTEAGPLEAAGKDVTSVVKTIDAKLAAVGIIAEKVKSQCKGCPTLFEHWQSLQRLLEPNSLSKVSAPRSFLALIQSIRKASKDEILKVLKSVDAVTSSQTHASLDAMLEFLNFTDAKTFVLQERFLYACGFASHPNERMLKALLDISKGKIGNNDIKESVVIIMGALVHKLCLKGGCNLPTVVEVKNMILKGPESTQEESQVQMYLLALKILSDLGAYNTIALTALQRYESSLMTEEVKRTVNRVFHQNRRIYEKNVRAAAADVILSSNPTFMEVKNLLLSIGHLPHEMNKYMISKIQDILRFQMPASKTIQQAMKDMIVNNYDRFSKVGSSSSFSGFMARSADVTSTYSLDILYSGSGILRRSNMNMFGASGGAVLHGLQVAIEAQGLESLIAATPDEGEENLESFSGMSALLFDVQLRPVNFFKGYSDLMSKMFSMSGDPLNVVKGLILLSDHSEVFQLQSGLKATAEFQGGLSIDISGGMEVSLWYRESKTSVNNRGALVISGNVTVDMDFLKTGVEVSFDTEASLDFITTVQFSEYPFLVCIQMDKATFPISEHLSKYDSLPSGKNVLSQRSKKHIVPGSEFPLHQENSNMCKKVFDSSW
ncbi:hypothetical protein WMY93_005631 [Mugilogobius chulae]|uniref:Vitellogenin domain-containing protein n=1 Tax=Mugilogobius chulae TaxID=88201 RepID=A0AAW0PLY7_9GOBI